LLIRCVWGGTLKQEQLKDYTTIRLPVLQLPALSHWSRHAVGGWGWPFTNTIVPLRKYSKAYSNERPAGWACLRRRLGKRYKR